jgi:hypothetical protein
MWRKLSVCRVHTFMDAVNDSGSSLRSHDCERGTQKCVRCVKKLLSFQTCQPGEDRIGFNRAATGRERYHEWRWFCIRDSASKEIRAKRSAALASS